MAPRTIKTGSAPLPQGVAVALTSPFESEEAGANVHYLISQLVTLLAANPSGTGKDTATNGVASTFMRSDAAFAIQKATDALFGLVKVDGTTITAAAGVISAVSQTQVNTTQSGTTYTAALADANTRVNFSNAGAVTFTVPANATVAFPVGTVINLRQVGAGVVTVTAAGGVTLQSAGGLVASNGQYSVFAIEKMATNVWAVYGNLA